MATKHTKRCSVSKRLSRTITMGIINTTLISNSALAANVVVDKSNEESPVTNTITSSTDVALVGTDNKIDTANKTSVSGKQNTVTQSDDVNIIGQGNTVSNSDRQNVIGNNNKAVNLSSGILIGDYQKLSASGESVIIGSLSPAEQEVGTNEQGGGSVVLGYHTVSNGGNNVVVGRKARSNGSMNTVTGSSFTYIEKAIVADKEHTPNVNNAVMIGYNTDVQKDNGVALGSMSVASTDAGIYGLDPLAGKILTSDADIAKLSGKESEISQLNAALPNQKNIYEEAKTAYEASVTDYLQKSSAYTAALMKYNSFDHSREDPEAGAARKKAMEDAKVAMDTAKRLPWIQLATR